MEKKHEISYLQNGNQNEHQLGKLAMNALDGGKV
jgi:hypothetical protein